MNLTEIRKILNFFNKKKERLQIDYKKSGDWVEELAEILLSVTSSISVSNIAQIYKASSMLKRNTPKLLYRYSKR